MEFNVIWFNPNKKEFEPYNVMPYFIDEYKKSKVKPKTFDEFKEFIKKNSMYMYWSRCEYEIILEDWPRSNVEKKIDIHQQIMMNIDIIAKILMGNG